MPDLPIITVPNKILKLKARKVTNFGPDLKNLISGMVETMRDSGGMGLAAPQVNQSIRLVVLEYEPTQKDEIRIPLTILINPTITDTSKETDWLDEGCLSIPAVEVPVERPAHINVLAQDANGKRMKIRAKDLMARIIQHEIDHINGVLMTERAYPRINELAGLRVMFMGSPVHVAGYLSALASTDAEIVGVVTETDKPAGRNQLMTSPPIKKLANYLHLPVLQFESLRDKSVENQMKAMRPDLVIVAAYGKIIPKSILTIPKYGFLNIHYSLLPALRGPSPHQTAILTGLKETGYTIFKLDMGIDTGPILIQKKIKIEPDDTSQTLLEKMAVKSVGTLLEVLPGYIKGERKLKNQDEAKATSTRIFTKEDGLINWDQPTETIEWQIRAMQPWPVAYTLVNGERLQIHAAHMEKDLLTIDAVQPAGKQLMTFADYLRGNQETRLTFFRQTGKVKLDSK